MKSGGCHNNSLRMYDVSEALESTQPCFTYLPENGIFGCVLCRMDSEDDPIEDFSISINKLQEILTKVKAILIPLGINEEEVKLCGVTEPS